MKGDNIAARLRAFAAGVLRICRDLGGDSSTKHIVRQLVRSATGGGANYEEARGAESRADFVHKLGIANKEIREALYWLQLACDAGIANEEFGGLIQEADELIAILTASIRTAKGRLEPQPAE